MALSRKNRIRLCYVVILSLIAGAIDFRFHLKHLELERELTRRCVLLQEAYEAQSKVAPEGVVCTSSTLDFRDRFCASWERRTTIMFSNPKLIKTSVKQVDGSSRPQLTLYPDIRYAKAPPELPVFKYPIGKYFAFTKVDGEYLFEHARISYED